MTDEQAMARALTLARQALGRTAPNPAVGAVLVRDGVVLGEGVTQPAGGPHAEIEALGAAAAAGHDTQGASLFVTLEPCCHHGRTPPCTEALIAAGVSRAVIGVTDPNPLVRGKGIAQLRAAGVHVDVGVRHEACARQILGFARAMVGGLPEVTVKVATSLDGHIATNAGESQWITGDAARADGRSLRATHDAILVGIGTALADDPRLTARTPGAHDPVPVVLDTHLRLPASARLLHGPQRAIVICGPHAPSRDLDAEVVRVAVDADGRVDPASALAALAERGRHRVLVEGGGEVVRSLLAARLVDQVVLYLAGRIVPGGRPWVGGAAIERLADGPVLELVDTSVVGGDVRLRYRASHRLQQPLAGLEG
mgnify:FL=1